MTSKGKQQMRKFSTFKEAAQKIVIKKPWGVEVKDYKAGDPIPTGTEFKIFNATDTNKIEAYADGLDESVDPVCEDKSVITRQLKVGDKFKIPGNPSQTYEVVNIKDDYLIYRNVRSHEEFQMVRGFASKVDLVEESATYQKKRFLEPYYMYNESAKTIKESSETKKDYLKYIDQFEKDVKKYIDWMKRDVKENKEIALPDVVVSLATAITNAMNRYNNAVKTKTLTESFIIQDSDSNNKPVYFHYGKYTGYDWGFDKNAATKFSTKEAAERMIEKMRQEGMLINSMKVVSESLSSKTHKFKPEELKVGKRVIDKVGGHEVHGKITVNHHDLYKDNPYTQDKKGSTVVTITTDKGRSYDVDANDNGGEFILEGRIAKGYENLDADEKARHLLSHPSSKYMNDLKSENITERAIRKAVKEMLGKPDKRDPQFITDVNEEGEAPAIANTTAEVANPDLPLKLKEGENSWEMGNDDKIEVKSDVVIRTTKDGEKFVMSRKEWDAGDSSNQEPNWRKMKEDEEEFENSIKYQTSVAGGMGTDAENAPSAKEYEDEVSLIKEHRSFRKFIKKSK